MTTYEDVLTLAIELTSTSSETLVFAARSVSTRLVCTQGPGGQVPEVISTLSPEQILGGVLPKVTSTLNPVQTIVHNIAWNNVLTTLVFAQTITANIKCATVTSTLVPVQTINYDNSVISAASEQPIGVDLGVEFVDNWVRTLTVTSTLVPVQGMTGSTEPYINLGGERYRMDSIYIG